MVYTCAAYRCELLIWDYFMNYKTSCLTTVDRKLLSLGGPLFFVFGEGGEAL